MENNNTSESRTPDVLNVLPEDLQLDNWCDTEVKTENGNYLWTIKNFSLLPETFGERLVSSTFSINNTNKLKWNLALYPNGRTENNYLAIFLILKSSTVQEVNIKFKVSLLNNNNTQNNIRGSTNICKLGKDRVEVGAPTFIKRDSVLNSQGILHNDELRIYAEIKVIEKIHSYGHKNQFSVPKSCFKHHISEIFKDNEFTDFVIIIEDKEIPVHKVILASRSPVFANMFKHDMEERNKNRLVINHTSYNVFYEMLRFIYTDEVNNIEEIAAELLKIADEYSLDKLKTSCEIAIFKTLSVENAIETLNIADMYRCEQLKIKTIDFIINHVEEIIKMSEWNVLMKINPQLINEVFIALNACQKYQ